MRLFDSGLPINMIESLLSTKKIRNLLLSGTNRFSLTKASAVSSNTSYLFLSILLYT